MSPAIFLDPYAPCREAGRAFADQCHKQTLPDYGMQMYIPHLTGPAHPSQTEGSAINETDPSFGYLNAPVVTLAGEVTVSQQLLDRAGPGFAFDRLIFDQLNRDYAPQWDTYVLNAALAAPTVQIWSPAGGFDLIAQNGTGGFYGQLVKAKAAIRTTAGTVLNPTHLFVTPSVGSTSLVGVTTSIVRLSWRITLGRSTPLRLVRPMVMRASRVTPATV